MSEVEKMNSSSRDLAPSDDGGDQCALATESAALAQLRAAGWSVAVHNDYRLAGERHTFWLLTHPNGRWIKGEGRTDAEALAQARSALEARNHAPSDDADQCSLATETLRVAERIAKWLEGISPARIYRRELSRPDSSGCSDDYLRRDVGKLIEALSTESGASSPAEGRAGNLPPDELLQSQARRVEELEGALRKIANANISEYAAQIARSALSEGSGSSRELAPPDESGDACGATERAEG